MTTPLWKCPNCAALFEHPKGKHDKFCPLCNHMLPDVVPPAVRRQVDNPPRSRTGETRKGRMRRNKIAALLARDGDRCWICGQKLGDNVTFDHYIPRSKGGVNALSNLRLAHRKCNHKRRDADPP